MQTEFDTRIQTSRRRCASILTLHTAIHLCRHQIHTCIFPHIRLTSPSTYLLRSQADYIIVDRVVVPPGYFRFFSEKLVYMPHSYQVFVWITECMLHPLRLNATYSLPPSARLAHSRHRPCVKSIAFNPFSLLPLNHFSIDIAHFAHALLPSSHS